MFNIPAKLFIFTIANKVLLLCSNRSIFGGIKTNFSLSLIYLHFVLGLTERFNIFYNLVAHANNNTNE